MSDVFQKKKKNHLYHVICSCFHMQRSSTLECEDITLGAQYMTPKKSRSLPFCGSSYTPDCDDSLKPAVGMIFQDIDSAKEFYTAYAAYVGFPVRVGQHKLKNGLVMNQRFYCSREGFRSSKDEAQSEIDCSKKRKCERKITRCGCLAMIALKRTKDSKYIITTFVEDHTHALVSPNKQHLIRSNREVGEKVKNTLFNFHRASIGTSDAYRFLRVGLGGFENVGCTLRDLQNYHGKLRCLIKSSDAQMFVDQLSRKALANPAFYFDYVIDEKGRLVHAFWADATCRKNYSHFGDLVSFDSTYSTNEYNMIFTPFTGVNHHKANVLFGAALLSNEKIESYTWLFKTFLNAMGGVEPAVIITDEDASMKVAIQNVFLRSIHRLCMWHILRKVPDKIGPDLREDDDFHASLGICVWSSETPEEFEDRSARIMIHYGLEHHEWFAGRFDIRSSWVPAYFRDIPLSGILRTTSRSESANSYFSRFIGFKHALVEFWLRFDTALEDQRNKELEADNVTLHTSPVLKTSWRMEKHGSELFTHEVFGEFQQELLAAREYCIFESMQKAGELQTMRVADNSKKVRVVQLNTSTMFASCSCLLFEMHGIPCRHVIHALRSAKIDELPSIYVLKRFRKDCKRESVSTPDGILLQEKANTPVNPMLQKLIRHIQQDRISIHSS
ncbi:unnamed protein product [Urochloa humidicola]